MTEKEIIEGNKLIAEFMGVTIHDNWGEYLKATFHKQKITSPFAGAKNSIENLKHNMELDLLNKHRVHYNTSWGWLMPVVEKIEAIPTQHYHGRFAVHIYSNSCTIQGTNFDPNDSDKLYVYSSDPLAVLDTKIESTWYNVVQFIKWHNSK